MSSIFLQLSSAIACDDFNGVQTALGEKPDLSRLNGNGETALLVAIDVGNPLIVEELLKAGADPDRGGIARPIVFAAGRRGPVGRDPIDIVRILIAGSANVNGRDAGGSTALMNAAAAGRLDIVQLLVDSGADVNALDDDHDTAASIAAYKGEHEIAAYILSLMSAPVRSWSEEQINYHTRNQAE